ncbi:Fur-regulated basic protein FbpA [Bacillus sp. RG28]|uniref:Fur-regulated basic protein FbpA n=1 Tax=Gottfriedia endophytica TaxID=2820819 RepID=A0A940NRK4_9BACI|nr:Fur-regulated basic protein FbpA [Gottfriedia endophytica]MBP0725561.1 Fur-regulated basic protein FbpA [Gottfriedia endophytica]
MVILYEAVEFRKNIIIDKLLKLGFTKMPDGRQLYELSLTELEGLVNEGISLLEKNKKKKVRA